MVMFSLAAMVAVSGAVVAADGQEIASTGACRTAKCREERIFDGGSGGLPTRLTAGTTKVELADGERYILAGHIELSYGDVYLQIDFDEHPWLAGAKRRAAPAYQIDDSTANWKKFEGKRVLVNAVARAYIMEVDGKYIYNLYLRPIKEPVLFPLRH